MSRRRRIAGRALAIAAVAALTLGMAADAGARVKRLRVTTAPGLVPRFSARTPDYVVRCRRGHRVRVRVAAPAGTRVSVHGRTAGTGRFTTRVRLRVGQRFRIFARNGRRRRSWSVRCLPRAFPRFTARRSGHPQAAWYVVTPTLSLTGRLAPYVAIFDSHGAPVWWFDAGGPAVDASVLSTGTLLWASGHDDQIAPGLSSGAYEEHRLDGTIVRDRRMGGGVSPDRHELQLMPNGHYLVEAYVPRDGADLSPYGGPRDATVLDARIEEVTRKGRVAWAWSTSDHVGLDESRRWYPPVLRQPILLRDGRQAYDIVHVNAIEPYGPHRVLVSLRNTDAVYLLDKRTGAVVWKLGGTKTSRSLKIRGDGGRPDFGGQHDVRRLRDGTVTLHDNGTRRGRPPRALRFRIDARARTARVVERVRDRRIRRSVCCGSARRLPGGDWVMSWGGTSLVTELTPRGSPVFSLRFGGAFISYRAFPVPPGQISRTALRRGMDRMQRH